MIQDGKPSYKSANKADLSFYYWERPKILDSTADQAAQAGCLPSGKRHVDPFPPLITKLPLAPKREFLAIPQGWRYKVFT